MTAPIPVWERMANRCAKAYGCTLEEIGGWYGVSKQAIEQRLRSRHPRIQGIPRKLDHDNIAADVVSGMTNEAIAAKHGCSVPMVKYVVRTYELSGLRENNKGPKRRAGRRQMIANDLGLIDPDVATKQIAIQNRTAAILAEFYAGTSHRQIATRLGLSLGMVQRVLKRAGLMGINSGSGANRSETVEDSANCLAERDERTSFGVGLHHDSDRGEDQCASPTERLADNVRENTA